MTLLLGLKVLVYSPSNTLCNISIATFWFFMQNWWYFELAHQLVCWQNKVCCHSLVRHSFSLLHRQLLYRQKIKWKASPNVENDLKNKLLVILPKVKPSSLGGINSVSRKSLLSLVVMKNSAKIILFFLIKLFFCTGTIHSCTLLINNKTRLVLSILLISFV